MEGQKISRWYFGGVASAGAACCTHPLDLLKVQLQTQQGNKKVSLGTLTLNIIKNQGIVPLNYKYYLHITRNYLLHGGPFYRCSCFLQWNISISFTPVILLYGAIWNIRCNKTKVDTTKCIFFNIIFI